VDARVKTNCGHQTIINVQTDMDRQMRLRDRNQASNNPKNSP